MPEGAAQGNASRSVPDSREGLRVLQGILGSVQGVVGEGAAQALFRYGAFEEGKRIATERSLRGTEGIVEALEQLIQMDAQMIEGPAGQVEVEIASSEVLAFGSPILDTLLLGLFEGLIAVTLGTRLRGQVATRGGQGSGRLVFRPEAVE